MLAVWCTVLLVVVGASAKPADPVILKLVPDDHRYQYVFSDEESKLQLVDTWLKVSDLTDTGRLGRFNADTQTQYHLFTRRNPTLSQVLIRNNAASITNSNFDPSKRTCVMLHGWLGSGTAGSNQALVPAYLAGEDLNVIVIDWSAGSSWGPNGVAVGRAVGNFINWLNSITGSTPGQFHIMGFSVGGHAAGIVGRNVIGNVGYVTGLDPAVRWETNEEFKPNDGAYTEVIHTSAGVNGWQDPLAQVDFYPNGGSTMPGCGLVNVVCDHERSYHYMAESLRSGGFNGFRCNTHWDAMLGNCSGARLPMGGRNPKNGQQGVYFVRTNSNSPFSQG